MTVVTRRRMTPRRTFNVHKRSTGIAAKDISSAFHRRSGRNVLSARLPGKRARASVNGAMDGAGRTYRRSRSIALGGAFSSQDHGLPGVRTRSSPHYSHRATSLSSAMASARMSRSGSDRPLADAARLARVFEECTFVWLTRVYAREASLRTATTKP